MRDPDEPAADGAPPLSLRPLAAVHVPDRRPAQLRRELARLDGEREASLRELGALVVEMSRQGELLPDLLATGPRAWVDEHRRSEPSATPVTVPTAACHERRGEHRPASRGGRARRAQGEFGPVTNASL
jgi:hypothetical protein